MTDEIHGANAPADLGSETMTEGGAASAIAVVAGLLVLTIIYPRTAKPVLRAAE